MNFKFTDSVTKSGIAGIALVLLLTGCAGTQGSAAAPSAGSGPSAVELESIRDEARAAGYEEGYAEAFEYGKAAAYGLTQVMDEEDLLLEFCKAFEDSESYHLLFKITNRSDVAVSPEITAVSVNGISIDTFEYIGLLPAGSDAWKDVVIRKDIASLCRLTFPRTIGMSLEVYDENYGLLRKSTAFFSTDTSVPESDDPLPDGTLLYEKDGLRLSTLGLQKDTEENFCCLILAENNTDSAVYMASDSAVTAGEELVASMNVHLLPRTKMPVRLYLSTKDYSTLPIDELPFVTALFSVRDYVSGKLLAATEPLCLYKGTDTRFTFPDEGRTMVRSFTDKTYYDAITWSIQSSDETLLKPVPAVTEPDPQDSSFNHVTLTVKAVPGSSGSAYADIVGSETGGTFEYIRRSFHINVSEDGKLEFADSELSLVTEDTELRYVVHKDGSFEKLTSEPLSQR